MEEWERERKRKCWNAYLVLYKMKMVSLWHSLYQFEIVYSNTIILVVCFDDGHDDNFVDGCANIVPKYFSRLSFLVATF